MCRNNEKPSPIMGDIDGIASLMETIQFAKKSSDVYDECVKYISGKVAYHFPEFPINIGLSSLKKYQSQMVHQMRAHENIVAWDAPQPYTSVYNTHTIVHMPTGSGKTVVGLQMAYIDKYPTHVDETSPFECVGSSGPNGAASVSYTANTPTFPNKNSTLIVVPPHLIQHWADLAVSLFKWKPNVDFVLKTESKKPRATRRPSKKAKTDDTDDDHLPRCVIVAANKSNMEHVQDGMWRRIIVDEPELISKTIPMPLAYHTFLLTASTDELFKIKTCCMSAFIQHVKDFDKKVKTIDFLDKMTISLDPQYYETFQMHHMNTKYEVVAGAKTLNNIVKTIPHGSNFEVTLALNMDDYESVMSFLKLSEDTDVPSLECFCNTITSCVEKYTQDVMKNVLSASQSAELLLNLDGLRKQIDTIKAEAAYSVGGVAKVNKLLKCMGGLEEEKVLILCKYGTHLVKSALDKRGIQYVDLTELRRRCEADPTSTSEQVARLLNSARNGSKNVIVVNPKYYGRGLDMQFAKHVFVMHSIAPHLVTQWIGRAFRQNRKEDLNVTYIYSDCEPPMGDDDSTDSDGDMD